MQNHKSFFQIFKELPKAVTSSTSPDARWGITSILFSSSLFLFPLSLSFWAISISIEGGKIMLPSSIISWIFTGLAVVSFLVWILFSIITLRISFYWYQSHRKEDKSEQLTKIQNAIQLLTEEVRRDRNERNRRSKTDG